MNRVMEFMMDFYYCILSSFNRYGISEFKTTFIAAFLLKNLLGAIALPVG
ncbi:hypothetical protein [Microcoleus sp. B7-D4]